MTGFQECGGYQYLVLPKMKWVLAIYDNPSSKVLRWEQELIIIDFNKVVVRC